MRPILVLVTSETKSSEYNFDFASRRSPRCVTLAEAIDSSFPMQHMMISIASAGVTNSST